MRVISIPFAGFPWGFHWSALNSISMPIGTGIHCEIKEDVATGPGTPPPAGLVDPLSDAHPGIFLYYHIDPKHATNPSRSSHKGMWKTRGEIAS